MGRIWPGSQGCPSSADPADTGPVLEMPDGSRHLLLRDATNSGHNLISKSRWVADCSTNSGSYTYLVRSPNGVRYYFDRPEHSISQGSGSAISVSKIVDANGNTIYVEYFTDSYHELVNKIYFSNETSNPVTLTYKHYSNSGTDTSFWNLDRVSFEGRSWFFHFDKVTSGGIVNTGYYFLSRVDNPGINDWYFTYHLSGNGLSNIKNVKAPSGVSTSYNYNIVRFDSSGIDFGDSVVVGNKTVSGADVTSGTWTYSYNPGSTTSHDRTTISGPDKTEVYVHFGSLEASSGEVWQIGTLLEHEIREGNSVLQKTTYLWEKDLISYQNNRHRRRVPSSNSSEDTSFWTARLKERNILVDGTSYKTTYSDYDSFGKAGTIIESGTLGNGTSANRTTNLIFSNIKSPWIISLLVEESVSGVSGKRSWQYDSAGNIIQENEYGVITNFSRCSNGEIDVITDANGNKTDYNCSLYRYGTSREVVFGVSTANEYTVTRSISSSSVILSENIGGKNTGYVWDDLFRIREITTPRTNDSNVFISWSPSGRVKTLTRGSFSEVTNFDGFGRKIGRNAEGIVQKMVYDAAGRMIFKSNPGSLTVGTSYTYDALDRVTKIDPPGNGNIRYVYMSGNQVKMTNENGYSTTYGYQSYGSPDNKWLTSIAEAEGLSTIISRNSIGKVSSIRQDGLSRLYTYNNRWQLTSINYSEIGTDIDQVQYFGRDNIGNMISRKFGQDQNLTQYRYDALNRLEAIDYSDVSTPDVTYRYNSRGLVTEVIKEGVSRWVYSYNSNDVLTGEDLHILLSPTQHFTMNYALNDIDNIISISYPSGKVYNTAVNDLGWISNISGYVSNISYHPNGALKQMTYNNGITTDIGQSDRLRISNIKSGNVVDLAYGFDNAMNVTSIIDNNTSLQSFSSIGYDGINRLVKINGNEVVRYDGKNNIIWNNILGRNYTYQYDNRNRLSRIPGTSYVFTYDTHGNVINNGLHEYAYNEANHLVSVNNGSTDYNYDGNDYRIRKVVPGGYNYYFYNHEGKLMYEKMAGNQLDGERDYLYVGKMNVSRLDYCGNIDSDGDNIPSCDETALGLNPQDSSDGLSDYDSDGLPTYLEISIGTNFKNSDSDSDGIPDGWEVTYGSDPKNSSDVQTDLDNDGLSLIQEYQKGTDPGNPDTDRDGLLDGEDSQPKLHRYAIPLIGIISGDNK